jgi:hypothetical protein
LSVKEHGVLNGVVILGRRARGRGIAVVGYGGGLTLSQSGGVEVAGGGGRRESPGHS